MCRRYIFMLSLLTLHLTACQDDEENYPSIITEFVDVLSNADGRLIRFTTDHGQTYQVTNSIDGFDPNAVYRAVCGYVPEEDSYATIYQLLNVALLRDSTLVLRRDPIRLHSVWSAGSYINMQLAPLGQGGRQYWGYAIDSITPRHVHLSLHHSQNGDPTSYTQNVYASIYVKRIEGYNAGDSISLAISTFDGIRHYIFVP